MIGFKVILRRGLGLEFLGATLTAQQRATEDPVRRSSSSGPNGHMMVV